MGQTTKLKRKSSMKYIVYTSFFASLLGLTSSKQGYGSCDRNTAKKIYILGETGVGKSTFSNVLTAQSPSAGCFKTGAGDEAVTNITYDLGCFPLVDKKYGLQCVPL